MRIICLFVIICICISCEYEPKNINYVSLKPVVPDTVEIDLTNQPDTISIINTTTFTYTVNYKHLKFYGIQVLMNDKVITSFYNSTPSFTFEINPYNFETNTYALKINVTTSTGSGNLAEMLQYEKLITSRSWTVLIDKAPPSKLNILKVYKENGRAAIEWEKNTRTNFKKYEVYKTGYFSAGNYTSGRLIATITNKDSTKTYDNYCIGGNATYWVENYSYLTSVNGVEGDKKTCSFNYPAIKNYRIINEDSIILSWNKDEFYNNFYSYLLSYNSYSISNTYGLLTYALSDTFFSIKMNFGEKYFFSLTTSSNYVKGKYGDDQESFTSNSSFYAGDSIPYYNQLVHSNNANFIYLLNYNKIYKYDLSQNKVEFTKSNQQYEFYPMYISPNGNYLVTISQSNLKILDPDNLNLLKTIDLSNYWGISMKLSYISLSNSGHLAFHVDSAGYYPKGCYVYDLNAQDTLFGIRNAEFINQSVSGKYLFMVTRQDTSLYKYTGTLEKIGNLKFRYYYYNIIFDPNDDERLLQLSSTSLNVLKSSDLSIISQYSGNFSEYLTEIKIDPISGFCCIDYLYSGNPNIIIYDYINHKVIATKKTCSGISFDFFNYEIFSPNGFKIKVQ